jgi:hypothetical protein
MDKNTGLFTIIKKAIKIVLALVVIDLLCIARTRRILFGLLQSWCIQLDTKTGNFRKYIPNSYIKSICIDSKGIYLGWW